MSADDDDVANVAGEHVENSEAFKVRCATHEGKKTNKKTTPLLSRVCHFRHNNDSLTTQPSQLGDVVRGLLCIQPSPAEVFPHISIRRYT